MNFFLSLSCLVCKVGARDTSVGTSTWTALTWISLARFRDLLGGQCGGRVSVYIAKAMCSHDYLSVSRRGAEASPPPRNVVKDRTCGLIGQSPKPRLDVE